MEDSLTEAERRRHLDHETVFQRLASKHGRGTILHDLTEGIDRYNTLLQPRDNATDPVEDERDERRADEID